MNKAAVRKNYKQIRLHVASKAIRDTEIVKRFLALPEFKKSQRVHCYYSIDSEVTTHSLLEQILISGKELYLPACEESALTVRRCTVLEDLRPDTFGIPTAPPKNTIPQADWNFDIVICPGLAFDCSGVRLGYGKGHYDTFLAQCTRTSCLVGICYEQQLTESLPREEHDIPMDILITDERLVRI